MMLNCRAMLPVWSPGTPIIRRAVIDGRVGFVRTATVVADREDLLALYIAPGYPGKRRTGVRGGPRGRVLVQDSGGYEDWTWGENRVLILYRPGDAHEIQLFRRDRDGAFLGWYVDLCEPLCRFPLGFNTRDHVLDVWMTPDRSSWAWKDEDEFAWRQEQGMLSREKAQAIRAEGERAVARLLADPALYKAWIDWRPDPAWPVPAIPDGWDRV
jgi:uncharacterized protein DUF402